MLIVVRRLTVVLFLSLVLATIGAFVDHTGFRHLTGLTIILGTIGILCGCFWAACSLLLRKTVFTSIVGVLLFPLSSFAIWVVAINVGISWLHYYSGQWN
jgi:hypothetical protein